MDIDTLIGVAAAPFIIPALVGATKPLVRLLFPKVCDDDVDNSPWQFLSAVYGALWMIGLVHSGHAPKEIDSFWTAILVGIALGLGSGVVRGVANKAAENMPTITPAEPDPPTPPPPPPHASMSEPMVARYEPARRSS